MKEAIITHCDVCGAKMGHSPACQPLRDTRMLAELQPSDDSALVKALEQLERYGSYGTLIDYKDAIALARQHTAPVVDEEAVRKVILEGLTQKYYYGGESLHSMYSHGVLRHLKAAGYVRTPQQPSAEVVEILRELVLLKEAKDSGFKTGLSAIGYTVRKSNAWMRAKSAIAAIKGDV